MPRLISVLPLLSRLQMLLLHICMVMGCLMFGLTQCLRPLPDGMQKVIRGLHEILFDRCPFLLFVISHPHLSWALTRSLPGMLGTLTSPQLLPFHPCLVEESPPLA